MPLYSGSKKITRVRMQNEPNSYKADIKDIEMQHGRTAIVKGKMVVGTGKAFEIAEYGSIQLRNVIDENGNTKQGFNIYVKKIPNLLFLASSELGDVILQTNILVSQTVTKVGENTATGSEVFSYHNGDCFVVYCNEVSSDKTKLIYFVGKDNEI